MQHYRLLEKFLSKRSKDGCFLYMANDFHPLFAEYNENSFNNIISRAAKSGLLTRVCRGVYAYEPGIPKNGYFLYKLVNYIRPRDFNYLSVESVLSEHGVISQIPINWIGVMSSGRSNRIDCGKFGVVEFTHTKKKPNDLKDHIYYDMNKGMFCADILLAYEDLKHTRRNLDLVDKEEINELI